MNKFISVGITEILLKGEVIVSAPPLSLLQLCCEIEYVGEGTCAQHIAELRMKANVIISNFFIIFKDSTY
jgi:hypothetical protein